MSRSIAAAAAAGTQGTDIGATTIDTARGRLRVVRRRTPYSQIACAMLFAQVGSMADPPGRSGLAHLFEHALFAGASGYPTAAEVADAAAVLGCRHNAHTYREYMYFYLSGPCTTARQACELLLTCYTRPAFAPAEIAKQRAVIEQELKLFAGQRERRLRDLVEQAVYGTGDAGRGPLGVASEIAAATDDDLRWFASHIAGPEQVTLIVDGPGDPLSGLGDTGEDWRPHARAAAGDLGTGYGPRMNILLPAETETALLAIAIPGPCYELNLRETYALRLFHTIMGGSASARLQQRLRDKLGLAYHARTTLEMHAATGALLFVLGCPARQAGQAAQAVMDLVGEGLAEGIEPGELARAREINRGTHVHERETAVGRCQVSGYELLRRGVIDDGTAQFDLWADISADEVSAVALRVLRPDDARAAAVGPRALTDIAVPGLTATWLSGDRHDVNSAE